MDFDIVIATRNRRAALQVSVPLMLSQSRLPTRLIVVDASDDHGEVRKAVEQCVQAARTPVALRIVESEPGSALQRNVGLRSVTAPVVMFPDDDALWFPHVAASTMAVYERDTAGVIGGVGGTESPVPPPALFREQVSPGSMDARDRVQLLLGRFLDRIEAKLFPDPFFLETRYRYGNKELPRWLHEEKAVRATVFPGFRMSFRTDLIRRTGFDETLGRYALFEDYDACLGVLDRHMLVDSTRAWVFHNRSPEKRVNGVEWGVLQVLNRAYVICKRTPPGSPSRRRLRAFSCYKLVRYLLQAQTRYGRQRVKGAMKALPHIGSLLRAPREELAGRYLDLRDRCLS